MSHNQHPRPTRSTPLRPSNRSMLRPTTPSPSYPGELLLQSRLELEKDLMDKEQQLKECTSAIQRNVLTRQISQLRDKLEQPSTDNTLQPQQGQDYNEKLTTQRSSDNLLQPPYPYDPATNSSSLLPLPPAPLTGSTPTQRRSKTPNNDRRNTDIEFATEIGQGLLIEVRKMQAILQEKEEQLRDLEIQKTDLERSAEAMAKQLRQREETEEHLKEETWNLELTKQELTLSVTEMQHQLDKSSHEQIKLSQQVNTLRNDIDQLRDREEKMTGALEQAKQRHEHDMSNMRRHCAGYQREAQQHLKQIETLTSELAIAKAQSRLTKQPTSGNHLPIPSNDDTNDTHLSDPTNPTSRHHHHHHHHNGSPAGETVSPAAMELETLKTSLAHAHRMVSNLRSHLHKEKTEKFEFKKLLAESQETIEQLQSDPHLWVDASPGALDDQQKKRKVKQHRRPTKKPIRTARSTARTKHTDGLDSDISEDVFSDDDDNNDDDDEDDDVPAGFTSLDFELSKSNVNLHSDTSVDQPLDYQPKPWTSEYLTCMDQAPVTLYETTTQTDHVTVDAANGPVHQEIQCDLLTSSRDNEAEIRALEVAGTGSCDQGVQCNNTMGTQPPNKLDTIMVDQETQCVAHHIIDSATQHEEIFVPSNDASTQYEGVANNNYLDGVVIDQKTRSANENITQHEHQSNNVSTQYEEEDNDHGWVVTLNNDKAIEQNASHLKDSIAQHVQQKRYAKDIATQQEQQRIQSHDASTQYEEMAKDDDWLGSLNNQEPMTSLSFGALTADNTKRYTQEQVDDAISKAVEESMARYKEQLGMKAGQEHQDMILVPARPHQPPPSTLLDKARQRSNMVIPSVTTDYPESLSSSSSSSSIGPKAPPINDQQSTPPTITSITQTMIGEWLTKYPRKHMGGQGFSDRRQHQRYFWIHPYTRTLYWSDQAPGSGHASELKAKSALVENVTVGSPDEGSDVPYLMVHTSLRQIKIKAPSKERHDIWLESLNYLLNRDGSQLSTSTIDLSPSIMPRRSVSASILRKPSFQRISDMFHRNLSESIHDDDDEEEGLENVRLCCGGKHDIGRLEKHEHHRPAYHQRKPSPLS